MAPDWLVPGRAPDLWEPAGSPPGPQSPPRAGRADCGVPREVGRALHQLPQIGCLCWLAGWAWGRGEGGTVSLLPSSTRLLFLCFTHVLQTLPWNLWLLRRYFLAQLFILMFPGGTSARNFCATILGPSLLTCLYYIYIEFLVSI